MNHIPSYGSIYALGHRAIRDIFESPVIVEEKIDGSQFSFGVVDGELCARSKGKDLILDAPEKMFEKAVEVVRSLDLTPGLIYRGEYLSKPKHNTLAYSRCPANHIMIYDIDRGEQNLLSYDEKATEAARIGLEVVPLVHSGMVQGLEMFQSFLERDSILGGCKVEGVVVKNYSKFTAEKKFYLGKFVSEAFKEVHEKEWRTSNPTRSDVVEALVSAYRTDARWSKAIQHMRDAGKLTDSPKDIGIVMAEVPADIRAECEADIKDALFNHFWPQIKRRVVAGLPEFYKEHLLGLSLGVGNEK